MLNIVFIAEWGADTIVKKTHKTPKQPQTKPKTNNKTKTNKKPNKQATKPTNQTQTPKNPLKTRTKTQATAHGCLHPAANAFPRPSPTELAVLLYTWSKTVPEIKGVR